jgi:hypothetical protein
MRNAPSEATTPDRDVPENPTPIDQAEGRPDMDLPGADRPSPGPDREDELPERLGERIENGPGEGIATSEPDLLPNVEVPDSQM